MKLYCVRCGGWREPVDLIEKNHINNTLLLKGKCRICNGTMCQIRGKTEVEKMRNDKDKQEKCQRD